MWSYVGGDPRSRKQRYRRPKSSDRHPVPKPHKPGGCRVEPLPPRSLAGTPVTSEAGGEWGARMVRLAGEPLWGFLQGGSYPPRSEVPAPQGPVGCVPQKASAGISPTEFLLPIREAGPPELCSDAAILHTLENDLDTECFVSTDFSKLSKRAGQCCCGRDCLPLPEF